MKRHLSLAGALLFAVGLFTGIWTAGALTGSTVIKDPHVALATHLNALLGGLWMIGVASTFDSLRYNSKQLCRLSFLVAIPAWANWGVTLAKGILGVSGLGFNGDRANDTIALLLQAFVVVPALVGSLYWVRGFVTTARSVPA